MLDDIDQGADESKARSMAHASTSHAAWPTRASTSPRTSTTIEVANFLEEFEDSELDDIFVAPADDPISSSDDDFDD